MYISKGYHFNHIGDLGIEVRMCRCVCVCVCSHDTIENIIIHTAHMKLEAINVSFDHVGALRVEVQVRMCMCLHDII